MTWTTGEKEVVMSIRKGINDATDGLNKVAEIARRLYIWLFVMCVAAILAAIFAILK